MPLALSCPPATKKVPVYAFLHANNAAVEHLSWQAANGSWYLAFGGCMGEARRLITACSSGLCKLLWVCMTDSKPGRGVNAWRYLKQSKVLPR